jgi:hypothetical protein
MYCPKHRQRIGNVNGPRASVSRSSAAKQVEDIGRHLAI